LYHGRNFIGQTRITQRFPPFFDACDDTRASEANAVN
jgi:hypothetical protein